MNVSLLAQPVAQAAPDQIASLGVAGLMGAMWLWERRTSRTREQQLDDAHDRILADRVQLDALMTLVTRAAEAMTKLAATQENFLRQVENVVTRRLCRGRQANRDEDSPDGRRSPDDTEGP